MRATGGVVAGAAVVGTVAATAQAGVSPADLTAVAAPGKQAGAAATATPQRTVTPHRRTEQPKAQTETTTESGAKPKPKPKESKANKRPTARDAIKLAESQVGTKEDGDGETKFQKWYMTTERAKETVRRDGGSLSAYSDAQWCDMFVSWIGSQLGFGDQMGSDAWTVAHAEWFEKQGRWGTRPKVGAVVFFAWDGGKSIDDISHVGLVTKVNGDGTVRTVEGNTSDSVQIRERYAGQIVGYGYPDYAS